MPILAESRLHRLGKFTDNIITWRNTVYSAQIKGIKQVISKYVLLFVWKEIDVII